MLVYKTAKSNDRYEYTPRRIMDLKNILSILPSKVVRKKIARKKAIVQPKWRDKLNHKTFMLLPVQDPYCLNMRVILSISFCFLTMAFLSISPGTKKQQMLHWIDCQPCSRPLTMRLILKFRTVCGIAVCNMY